MTDKLGTRVQADHLRKTLLKRNHGETFCRILAGLTDEQLLQMAKEHHDWHLLQLRTAHQKND
jgi:hypothetical protein